MLPSAPFDAAKSIFAGMSVIQLAFAATPLTGVTATTAGVFTKTAHGLSNGMPLRYESGTGGTGLTVGTTYYVIDAAANTFKLATTPAGVAIEPSVALSVGVFSAAMVFEAKKLESQPAEKEVKYIELPDKKGVLRRRRKQTTKRVESFTFHIYEIKRLLELFGGALDGDIDVKVTLWIPDPQDETGKVALKSEADFDANISRDGALGFGEEFSESTIRIESLKNGDITWTADAAA